MEEEEEKMNQGISNNRDISSLRSRPEFTFALGSLKSKKPFQQREAFSRFLRNAMHKLSMHGMEVACFSNQNSNQGNE